jgi:hypothetical protein
LPKNTKATLAILIAFVILIAAAGIIWQLTRPQGVEGAKTITVEVVTRALGVQAGTVPVYTIHTDALFLRGALEERGLIAGDESPFGLFVKTVDGYTVNESRQEWWNFAVNGEDLMVGVDEAVIQDGDKVTITLMVGW